MGTTKRAMAAMDGTSQRRLILVQYEMSAKLNRILLPQKGGRPKKNIQKKK